MDTRGINVWCAAGKGTFSTEEVSYQVKRTQLSKLINHRTLILPQLGAVGVAALQLKDSCGFRGKFGPVRINDLPSYLANNQQTDERMRSISFSFTERAVLIPVELRLTLLPLIYVLLAVTTISGIGPDGYTLDNLFSRSTAFLFATLTAILSGAILTPLLLPWIPGRQFWLKGAQVSLVAALFYVVLRQPTTQFTELIAIVFWIIASGSYLAMNFTGSTPFTSLTGVEFEMRRGLPLQIMLAFTSLCLWIAAPFI